MTRNSSAELQEILTIGDPDSSLALAAVTNVAPASTRWALNTRIVSGPSSLVDLSVRAVLPSTATDNPVSAAQASTVWAIQADGRVRAQNSTAADLLASVAQTSTVWQVQLGVYSTIAAVSSLAGVVTAAPVSSSGVSMSTDTDPASTKQGLIVRQVGFVAASTTMQVSSLAGAVITRSSAADQLVTVYQSSYSGLLARVQNSTAGDLLASVAQTSTVWQVQAKIQDSSAVGFVGTTTRPTTGAQGLVVRTCLNDLQSTAFSTMGNNSTSSTIVSSAAAPLRIKVYAYSITSTVQAINSLSFASSLANLIWTAQLQSISSAISGVNLAVSPPAWLFATEANSPLVFKITGTTGTYHLSVAYFIEA